MRLPRFGIIAVVSFLIVVILNIDFGFTRGLLGGGKGGDERFIRESQVLAQTPDERKAEADRLLQQGFGQLQVNSRCSYGIIDD